MNKHYSPDLTSEEFRQAIRLARKMKAMQGKAIHHACGDLHCYDPKCLTVIDPLDNARRTPKAVTGQR